MFTGVYGSWLQLLVNIHGKCGGGFLTTISLWFSFHIFLSFRLFFQILFTGLCLYVFSVSIGAEWGGFRKVKRLPDSFLSFFLIFHVFFFSPSLFLYKHEYIFDFFGSLLGDNIHGEFKCGNCRQGSVACRHMQAQAQADTHKRAHACKYAPTQVYHFPLYI